MMKEQRDLFEAEEFIQPGSRVYVLTEARSGFVDHWLGYCPATGNKLYKIIMDNEETVEVTDEDMEML